MHVGRTKAINEIFFSNVIGLQPQLLAEIAVNPAPYAPCEYYLSCVEFSQLQSFLAVPP
jgi:hypothetical protein